MVRGGGLIAVSILLAAGCRTLPATGEPAAGDEDTELPVVGTLHDGIVETSVGRLRGSYRSTGDSIILDDDVTTDARDLVDPNAIAPRGFGIVSAERLWPDGVVPYVFDDGACKCRHDSDSNESGAHYSEIRPFDFINGKQVESLARQKIKKAMRMWEATGAVRFVEDTTRTASDRYVRLCSWSRWTTRSRLGRQPGSLEGQCLFVGRSASTGNIVHELGHALGLIHEHQRFDRDRFVTIHFDKIEPSRCGNFQSKLESPDLLADLGPYDYGSIMHYGARMFGKMERIGVGGHTAFVRAVTIEVKAKGVSIGQRDRPSAGDLEAVRMMYGRGHQNEVHFPDPPIVHAEPEFRGRAFALTASHYDPVSLAREGISRVRSLAIPAGTLVRLCETEHGDCSHHDGRVANYAGSARHVFVERATTVTTPAGELRTFRVGSRSSLVDIERVLVPPGMILRACGVNECVEATWLMTPPFEPRSRIEVIPAVTIFAGQGFTGRSRTLSPGLYLASRGEFGPVSSLAAGPGVNVRICNEAAEPTAENCVDLHGDVVKVSGSVNGTSFGGSIVRIDVTACVPGTSGCPAGGAAACGDGVCRAGESAATCPRDCHPPVPPPPSICERQPWKCETHR